MIGIVCAFFHTEGKGFYSKSPDRPSDPPGRSDRGCISICMDDPDII